MPAGSSETSRFGRSQNGGNNGSDPQIREEIRMAPASSRREFRGTWPRTSSDQNLILWQSHEIRWFDVITTPRRRSALDTGAPDGPNFAAVPRNSPVSRPRKFRGAQIRPRSSLRIYSRIPRSLLVIRPVIAPGALRQIGRASCRERGVMWGVEVVGK